MASLSAVLAGALPEAPSGSGLTMILRAASIGVAALLSACGPPTNPVGCGRHRFIVATTASVEGHEVGQEATRILRAFEVGYGLAVPGTPGVAPLEVDVPEGTPPETLSAIEDAFGDLSFVTDVGRPPFEECTFDPSTGAGL